MLPKLKNIITVSEHISKFYTNKYKSSILVIRNVPFLKKKTHKSVENIDVLNHKKNEKNIIYQGSLNKDRGIELMIEVIQYLDANLFIIGSGDLTNHLKNYRFQRQQVHNLIF